MASNFKYDTLMLNVALIFLGKIGETLEMGKQFITQEQMTERLDQCYFMAIHGVPGSKSCDILATEYLDRYGDSIAAAKKIYG